MSSAPVQSIHLPLFLRLIALGSLAAVLTGCPGGGTLDDSPTGTGGGSGQTCDATPIFVAKCDGVFCHGSSSASPPTGGVELVTPPAGMTLGQSLFDKPASYPNATAACPTTAPERIIDSVAPASSLLLNKLTGAAGAGFACGEPMPPAPVSLTAAELDCVTQWVNSVAQTGGI
jgi:hypothetical protein